MKTIWFERNKIGELLLATRTSIYWKHGIAKMNLLKFFGELLFLGIFLSIACNNYFIAEMYAMNDGWFTTNEILRKLWVLVFAHMMAFEFWIRFQLPFFAFTFLIVNLNVKRELNVMPGNFEHGLEIFGSVRDKIHVVNMYFENQLLAYFIIAVSFYCGIPEVVKNTTYTNFSWFFAFDVMLDFSGWIIAAEYSHLIQNTFLNFLWEQRNNADRTMTKLYSKLACENYDTLQNISKIEKRVERLQLINEFQFEHLTISCRFFRVTYGFISSVSFTCL